MGNLASAEKLKVEVNYGQLSPTIHTAIGRIVSQRSDGIFKVDGVGEEDLGDMRNVLKAAEGYHLPQYFYDEQGNYIAGGWTPKVEERHSKVAMLDGQNSNDDAQSLWLRVPRHLEDSPESEVSTDERLSHKQFLFALGGTGVAANAMVIAGLYNDEPAFFAGYGVLAVGMMAAAISRVKRERPTSS